MAKHTKEEFDDELFRILQEARGEGRKLYRVVSKRLHDRVVTEAGNHRMPAACDAMWRLWEEQGSRQERIIRTTPKGRSTTIEIEFSTGLNEKLKIRKTNEALMYGSVELEEFIDVSIEQSEKKGYIPKVFISMRSRYGTVEAIKRLVSSKGIQKGFRRLKELGLLDLSIEAAVLKFPDEFTHEEWASAKWRLEQVSTDFDLQNEKKAVRDENFRGTTTSFLDVKAATEQNSDTHAPIDDGNGETPLHVAAASAESPAVVELLLDEEANIDARDTNGKTPLHDAVLYNENLEVIGFLLDRGANIHARDARGHTPLHLAAGWSRTPEVVALLLDRGADIHARDINREMPLHQASSLNTREVIALLLDRGADIHARDTNGETPLHQVSFSNKPEVVSLLLERGADIHACDASGITPLHIAAIFSETPEVVALLLEQGASPTVRDKKGKTPFDYAKENEYLRGSDVYWRLNEARFQ